MAVVGWIKRMSDAFGVSFLWLVCLIYFTQGFRSFVWTAVSYQLKDIIKLSPSASQFLVSVAYFPWSIKPIYGILSDCVPIRERKRVPYLIISSVLSGLPWIILGSVSFARDSSNLLAALLTVQSVGSAMSDVVIDAMIAEAVHSAHLEFAGDLQSLSWSAMAFGGMCGSILGGYSLSNFQIQSIFLLYSALPTIQLLSCFFVDEIPKFLQNSEVKGYRKVNSLEDDHVALSSKTKSDVSRRRKNVEKNHRRKQNLEISSAPKKAPHAQLHYRLKNALWSLWQAFKQPIILRPMAWFFISLVVVPNLSTVMFYYQTEALHLEASFLGTARVIGWLSLMLGTHVYNLCFKRKKLRNILMFAQLGLSLACFFDVILVSRWHVQFGISDERMVLFGSAFGDAINQFKFMPFLILSGQLCPPGIEGTLFALFMSVNNLGSTIGSFHGAAMSSLLNISSHHFDNLLLGAGLQAAATLLPICFLSLIPDSATGLKSS